MTARSADRPRDYRVIVFGLGGIGSGALYWLARRLGSDVLGLEQFELGHDRGGSQDHSRIIRYSYHRPHYVELAKRAYQAWSELEADAKVTLVHRCGGLDLFPEGGTIPLSDYTESLDAGDIEYELIDDREITRRWPQFRHLDRVTGLFQRDGGLVAAADANAAHQKMAREHGAELVSDCRIERVRSKNGEIEIETARGHFRSELLVVAAGAWSNRALADLGRELPLTVTQEQVSYYSVRDLDRYGLEQFPAWIWMGEPSFYGVPVFGESAIKIGQDVGGQEVTADTRTFDVDAAALQRNTDFIERHLPEAFGKPPRTKSCLYTLTPDRDFVVDRVPGHDNVLTLIGAGHAFKFASVLGRIASEVLLDGSTPSDLGAFSITRPILLEKDPPKSFMV